MKVKKLNEQIMNEAEESGDVRRIALANYLGVDLDDVQPSSYDSNLMEVEAGKYPDEYLVVTAEEAEEYAKEDIKSLIDDMGIEGFSKDFQEWIVENALEPGWFEDAQRESNEFYVEDIESESSREFDNRLIEELYDADLLDDEDFETDEDGDPDFTALKDSVDLESKKEEYIDKLCEDWPDAVEWYRMNFGDSDLKQLIKDGSIYFDDDAVAEEVIALDGVANSLARYDGEEIDLNADEFGEPLYAYRQN